MMDAHTARLMIVGGGLVAVGGCVILKQLARPKPATPQVDEVRFQGINADGTARLYMTGVKGAFDIVVGDGPPLPGRRFNAFGEFVLSDAEKAGIAEADRIRAQLADPKPAANPVAAGLFVSCAHPECGCEVEALCPEASARHGDPAGMMASASPTMREEGAQLADRAREIRQAAHVSQDVSPNEYMGVVKLTDKDLLATGYDPRHGRQWYVKRVRSGRGSQLSWRWALYGPNRFAGLYTRKTSAIRGAYRRNAKIGKD